MNIFVCGCFDRMNIFVCGCLEKSLSGKKTIEIIDKVFNPCFDSRFVKFYFEYDIFICCRDMISFCYEVNRWYFYNKTCASEELFSCYGSFKFGFSRFCSTCISPLKKKLFPFLIKIV